MKITFYEKYPNENSPWAALLIIIGFLLLGMVFGNVAAAVIMIVVGGIGTQDMFDINGALMASPSGWLALMLGQAAASIITFIMAGLLYWRWIEKRTFSDFHFKKTPSAAIFLFIIIIQVFFMPFNGWLQSLNESMKLPASLQGLEELMKSMEDSLAEITKFLTTFTTVGQLLLAIFVIAVLAGVGEELIFRGLIQRKLYLATQNPHAAIWLTAFLFSAIHFQFYGFLPRMFLGAMFGYFYFFTGNLWVPIVGHIFNNGIAVVMLYLVNQKKISPEIEKMDNVPFAAVVASLFIGGGLVWYFQRFYAAEEEQ
jgi:uncharacterized protein